MAFIYLHKENMAPDVEDAAIRIKEMFYTDLSNYEGKIWILPSICAYSGTGQDDIDIMILGYLNNYTIPKVGQYSNISFYSFCAAVEVKSHDAQGIYADGTHLWVKYPRNINKDVTEQSKKQSQTLQKVLADNLYGESIKIPFVSNVIWLTGITKEDFKESIGIVDSNILCSNSTTDDLFSAIARRSKLHDNGFFNAFRGTSSDEIEWVAKVFYAHANGADSMSVKRLNLLHCVPDDVLHAISKPNQIIVLSGHAGTGKTIMLLQSANYLMSQGKKCLFLTYNVALLSDLKHSIQYIPGVNAPDMKTMHQFFLSYLNHYGIWDNTKNINNDFLDAVNKLRLIYAEKIKLNYDYILVDEAQDWSKTIIDALKILCKTSGTQIVIADGVDQFMQRADQPEWGIPTLPKLKICKRQCRNLTIFARAFAAKLGVVWDVIPNNELAGGQVIVTNSYDGEMHKKFMDDCKMHGGTAYDYMLLASNSLIDNGKFTLKELYEKHGYNIYDATNPTIRDSVYDEMNSKNNELRVYPYESCRGLEAWTVVCMRFNELFSMPHPHDYKEIQYEVARKHMQTLWALMPLTRAVHTLIITLSGNDSHILPIMRELEQELDGIVSIKIK